jgi:DNA-directed RNA polymerase subunit RPC12/RpoP
MIKIKCLKCNKKADKLQGNSFTCIYCGNIVYKIDTPAGRLDELGFRPESEYIDKVSFLAW